MLTGRDQILLNGSRLGQSQSRYLDPVRLTDDEPGFYEPLRLAFDRALSLPDNGVFPGTALLAGAASGAVGGMSRRLTLYTTS